MTPMYHSHNTSRVNIYIKRIYACITGSRWPLNLASYLLPAVWGAALSSDTRRGCCARPAPAHEATLVMMCCPSAQDTTLRCSSTQDTTLRWSSVQDTTLLCSNEKDITLRCTSAQDTTLRCTSAQDTTLRCTSAQDKTLRCLMFPWMNINYY